MGGEVSEKEAIFLFGLRKNKKEKVRKKKKQGKHPPEMKHRGNQTEMDKRSDLKGRENITSGGAECLQFKKEKRRGRLP